MRLSRVLLLFIPISIGLWSFNANPLIVFITSALGLIPLAGLMGDATEALAESLGPTYGGLLNASLGNAPEIIIGFFALRQGLVGIVKASITGSILGNLLLGLGLSLLNGGLRHGPLRFNTGVARMNAGLLTIAAIGLVIPAVFRSTVQGETRAISAEIACVLFFLYLASLVFTLWTHHPAVGVGAVEAETGEKAEPEEPGARTWTRGQALGVLSVVALTLAFMSEILTDAIEPASRQMGLTPIFAGVFLLSAAGNAAELLNALRFARKGQMDLVIGLTAGASIQVALVVAPMLVFFGMLLNQPMNLLFSNFEVVAIALAVFITRNLTVDGQSNWLEGLMLLSLYIMLGVGFYYLPANAASH